MEKVRLVNFLRRVRNIKEKSRLRGVIYHTFQAAFLKIILDLILTITCIV